ncbi:MULTISPECIES: hypothetical protein [unclassified Sphingopyxis]|uniref:hypothetical protein n=1 Tax=unclassified Sphingopyxis TaxID=2614943 RepID=UPI00073670AB|nr:MULTISPECIES: hypothetical protein [unclassified Sphingopyxis]KTE37418.1 hypothetical protein ATE62_13825 [Sphingopyxis sp. HIX]KTE85518.1 hypothetical protein ATE72_03460 [Sphingopyxis sp. HXXIV]
MSASKFVATGFAAALLTVLPVIGITAPERQLRDADEGYRLIVDHVLIPRNILVATDALDTARQDADTLRRSAVVRLDEARLDAANREIPGLRGYVERSYLRQDIARNDPALWIDDNVLVGIAPGAHAIISPLAQANWNGDLLYRGSERNSAAFVRLNGTGGDGVWRPLYRAGVAGGGWDDGFYVAAGSRGAIELRKGSDADRDGDMVLAYRRKGRQLTLPAAAEAHYCNSEDAAAVDPVTNRLTVEPGTCLRIAGALPDGARLDFIEVPRSRVVGAETIDGNERYARLSRSARSSMSAWAQWNPARARSMELAIETTLDFNLSQFAQQALDSVYDAQGLRRPAAITIMDARNGEILGMASREGNDLFRPVGPLGDYDVNFREMPVGSVAKPLVAEAIFSSFYKDGRMLEVADTPGGADQIDQVLGVDLNGSLHAPAVRSGGWIDAQEFIAFSSNQYAAALMMLTSCAEPAEPRSANRDYRNAGAAAPCFRGGGRRTIELPWKRDFESYYISPDSPGKGTDDAGGHRGLDKLALWGEDDWAAGLPNPANIHWPALEGLQSFRAQVVPIILGGQDYAWNNIVLAQSYARLVTGRRVNARLRPWPASYRPARMAFERNQAICRGLEDVANVGTAAAPRFGLRDRVMRWRPGAPDDFILLSKTGTPTSESATPAQLQTIGEVNRDIRGGRLCLAKRGADWAVDTGDRCRARAVPAGPEARERRTLGYRGVDVLFEGGRPIRALGEPGMRYDTKAYVFVVGARAGEDEPARIGCAQLPPKGPLVVVAVNFQDPTVGTGGEGGQSDAHLRVASELLAPGGALARWILDAG